MTPDPRRPPAPHHYAELVRRELATDLGSAGDVTTDATVPARTRGTGRFVARREGRVGEPRCKDQRRVFVRLS